METVSNKLQPAFSVLQDIGIKAISSVIEKIEGMDFSKLVTGIEQAKTAVVEFMQKKMCIRDRF